MSDALAQPEMPLEGAVRDADVLPRLVSELGRREWSGQVHVRSGDVERRLYLVDGHLQTATSNDPAESLTAFLVDKGLVSAQDVEDAAKHVGATDYGLGFARKLVELGLVSRSEMLETELERVIRLGESVLSLRNGVYRCEIGPPPSEMISHALDLPRLIATAVLSRWQDTWAMNVLGGMGTVLRLNKERLPDYEATGADEAYDLTLLRVDGHSTLSEVLGRSPLPELAAVKFLAACRLLGIVEPTDAQAVPQATSRRPVPVAAEPEPAPVGETTPPAEPPAPIADRSEPEAVAEEGESTTPGFYRPQVQAPAPRVEEPLMKETPERSGVGRWLGLLLLIGLLAAVAWFGWKGLSTMSEREGPATPSGEAAP